MKIRAFLLAFSCFFVLSVGQWAGADENVVPYDGNKVPADVRARMLKGAKSRRFGVAKIGRGGTDVLLHLYELKDNAYLDILQRVGKARRRRLVRLKTLRLNESALNGSFDTYWLDPKQHKAPIITVDATDGGGFGSTWDLYIFPQGLQQKVVKDEYSMSFSSVMNELRYSFVEPDSRGFAVIKEISTVRTTTDYTPEQIVEAHKGDSERLLYWNGNGFIPAKAKQDAGGSK